VNTNLTTKVDTMVAMLNVAAAAFTAEVGVLRELHCEHLISREERDWRIATAEKLMVIRQNEAFL